MIPLLVLLLALLLLAVLASQRGASDGARRPARRRRTPKVNPYWLLGGLVLGLVLLRFGVNWLVVARGMLAAALRSVVPLLRLLPLLETFRRGAGASGGRPFGSGPGGQGPASDPPRRPGRMSRQEALQVFGLHEGATPEDVQREYKRLMRKIHPDLGGSSYLAAKINEAKDVLS